MPGKTRALAGVAEAATLLVDDVPQALDAARVHLRYQPIVSVLARQPVAVEVLARLDHPTLGMLFPDQFIPQVENAGLVRELTQSVVDTALTEYRAELGAVALTLTLNVPLDMLMRRDTADWLARRCDRAGLPARRVVIELTESQPVADLDGAGQRALQAAMARLKALGYRLAIDDFGPEMPRRQALFTLPFDFLKLDKAVVINAAQVRIVEQAVQLSRQHGLRVVAEGVEDEATWSRMQALGVDYIQGFLVSRPLPATDVADWLWRWPVAAAAM